MTGRRIEAVLFDAVGTLLAPAAPVAATYARVAAAHGLVVEREAIEGAFRRVFPAMAPMAFPDASPEAVPALERGWWRELVVRTFRDASPTSAVDEVDALFPALFDVFAAASAWRLRDGATAALDALRRRGRRSAVLSNFDHRLHGVLAELGLGGYFEFVLLPGEAGAAKPDPAIFQLALEKLGLPAPAVALVGDDERDDLEGATAAGLHGVDVRRLATLADLEAHLVSLEDGA